MPNKKEEDKRVTEQINEEEKAAIKKKEALTLAINAEQQRQAILLGRDLREEEKKEIEADISQETAFQEVVAKKTVLLNATVTAQQKSTAKKAIQEQATIVEAPAEAEAEAEAAAEDLTEISDTPTHLVEQAIAMQPQEQRVISTPSQKTLTETEESGEMTKEKALKILQIDDPNADLSTINSQYRKRARALHPDKLIHATEAEKAAAEKEFEQVRRAVEFLRNDPSIPLKNEKPIVPASASEQQLVLSTPPLETITDTEQMTKQKALSILNIKDPNANLSTINSQYRKHVRPLHPDNLIHASEEEKESAKIKFRQAQEAVEFLRADSSVPGVAPLTEVGDTPTSDQDLHLTSGPSSNRS